MDVRQGRGGSTCCRRCRCSWSGLGRAPAAPPTNQRGRRRHRWPTLLVGARRACRVLLRRRAPAGRLAVAAAPSPLYLRARLRRSGRSCSPAPACGLVPGRGVPLRRARARSLAGCSSRRWSGAAVAGCVDDGALARPAASRLARGGRRDRRRRGDRRRWRAGAVGGAAGPSRPAGRCPRSGCGWRRRLHDVGRPRAGGDRDAGRRRAARARPATRPGRASRSRRSGATSREALDGLRAELDRLRDPGRRAARSRRPGPGRPRRCWWSACAPAAAGGRAADCGGRGAAAGGRTRRRTGSCRSR